MTQVQAEKLYEWTCPHCDQVFLGNWIDETMECEECKAVLTIIPPPEEK